MTDDLLGCPFCGSSQVTTAPMQIMPGWSSMCKCCCAQFICDTEEDAIRAWNTRSPSSEEVERQANLGTTHGVGCETWGPKHYECLVSVNKAEIGRAEAAEARIALLERVVEETREGLVECRQFAALFIAFDGRDRNTPRMEKTLNGLVSMAIKADETARAILQKSEAPK